MKRFSIRDLLLLTAFVALVLGWWIDRHNRATASARFHLQIAGDRAQVVDATTGQVCGTTPLPSQVEASVIDQLEQRIKRKQPIQGAP